MKNIELEKVFLKEKVELAKKMQRLNDNQDFKDIFGEGYVEAYALTQVANCGSYNPDQLRGMASNMVARGKFVDYVTQVIEEGQMAVIELSDIDNETIIQTD